MDIVIFGNSEIARCAYEYFTHDSDHTVVAFTVDAQYIGDEKEFLGLPLVPFEGVEKHYPPENHAGFVAVGSQKLNRIRTEKYSAMKEKGYDLASYVSSRAFVWHDVKVGDNAFILEDNTLQTGVEIGDNVTLWSGNHIGHGSKIDDHCFITSHVVISGLCTIGQSSFIGVNATVAENVTLGADNFICMAAIVAKDAADNAFLPPAGKSEESKITAKRFCKVKD